MVLMKPASCVSLQTDSHSGRLLGGPTRIRLSRNGVFWDFRMDRVDLCWFIAVFNCRKRFIQQVLKIFLNFKENFEITWSKLPEKLKWKLGKTYHEGFLCSLREGHPARHSFHFVCRGYLVFERLLTQECFSYIFESLLRTRVWLLFLCWLWFYPRACFRERSCEGTEKRRRGVNRSRKSSNQKSSNSTSRNKNITPSCWSRRFPVGTLENQEVRKCLPGPVIFVATCRLFWTIL